MISGVGAPTLIKSGAMWRAVWPTPLGLGRTGWFRSACAAYAAIPEYVFNA